MGGINFGAGGIFVLFGSRERFLRGSAEAAGARLLCQTAVFSVAMRCIGRAVMAEMSRRLAGIAMALPLVFMRSHLLLPFLSAWRSMVHWPRSFFRLGVDGSLAAQFFSG